MLRKETRRIGGLEIQTKQLPVRRGLRLMNRLGRILAPVFAKADFGELMKGTQGDLTATMPAFVELFDQIHPDDLDSLLSEILLSTGALVDGRLVPLKEPEMIDHVFAGKIRPLLETVLFALEVNFSDVFTDGSETQVPEPEATPTPTEDAPKI